MEEHGGIVVIAVRVEGRGFAPTPESILEAEYAFSFTIVKTVLFFNHPI